MKNRINGEEQNVGFYYYYRNFIDQHYIIQHYTERTVLLS